MPLKDSYVLWIHYLKGAFQRHALSFAAARSFFSYTRLQVVLSQASQCDMFALSARTSDEAHECGSDLAHVCVHVSAQGSKCDEGIDLR